MSIPGEQHFCARAGARAGLEAVLLGFNGRFFTGAFLCLKKAILLIFVQSDMGILIRFDCKT